MANGGPVAAVEPEVISVLVQDKNLGWQARRDHPLPFRHDRFGRADQSNYRVALGAQFGIKARARLRAGIVRYAKDLATTLVELDWRAGIAGKQVGGHFGMNVIQACEQV